MKSEPIPELVEETVQDEQIPLHRYKSLISFLLSTTLHLFTLVALTLLLVSVDKDEPLHLEFSVADVSADESFETFEVAETQSLEVSETESDQFDSSDTSTEPTTFEPELVDLGDIAAGPQNEVASSESSSSSSPVKSLKSSSRSGSFFGANATATNLYSLSILHVACFRHAATDRVKLVLR